MGAAAKANGWTLRRMADGELAAVGAVIGAAFASIYRPAVGDDPALAAALGQILPVGVPVYVAARDGVIGGAGLLRYADQATLGGAEAAALWQTLCRYQALPRALLSLWRLSLLGAEATVDRATGYISSLAVAPACQGQGLGHALLDHLEDQSRMAGKTRLALHVIDSNARAIHLYEAHGFRLVRRERSFLTARRWGYRAQLYLVKTLT